MRNTVMEMLSHQEQITSKLKEWVKDKDVPLDERWDVFIKSGLGKNVVCNSRLYQVLT